MSYADGDPRRMVELVGKNRCSRAMGIFYSACRIENVKDRDRSVVIPNLLVDTGSEYTWISEAALEKIGIQREKKDFPFITANGPRSPFRGGSKGHRQNDRHSADRADGQQVTRSIGFAIIRLDKYFTIE